ncbi:MAG: T9SS type A sorting domain-containing protein, partial [Sphingobacteriales bacterium]|nr:T9SS type A sorting domain-containing protein [Sphingobacteriales bacterium]
SPQPSVTPIGAVCVGQAVDLTDFVQGDNLLWYTSPFGVGSATAPAVNTSTAGTQTFYVSQTTGDCTESALAEVTLQVVPQIASAVGVVEVGAPSGGVSPFDYNQAQIVISGGLAPYNFDWDITGYVRYDIEYNGNSATISIYYADGADWIVTITDDATQCNTQNPLVFANNAGGNTELNIDSYDIDEDSGASDGAVNITVSGGCNGYTYAWDGPNGFTAATQDVSGLATGWYHVVVTDCAGDEAEGWYWVGTERRGRKTDMASINAYPNPTAATTNITFTVGETGNTTVAAFDLTGKQIANLFNAKANAGETYNVSLDAANLPAGMYIVKLTTQSGMVETYKLTVAR